jgi:hypothetical protein
MRKFRLPRKIKKKLHENLWLYPADETGNRLAASPHKNQEDYNAVKDGTALDIMYRENSKAERKAYREKLDAEVTITNEELRSLVNDIFALKYRTFSYATLIAAKNHPGARIAYYNFVNAYNLSKTGGGCGNVCCLAVDSAKVLLKKGSRR